jgi:hypothetical protein
MHKTHYEHCKHAFFHSLLHAHRPHERRTIWKLLWFFRWPVIALCFKVFIVGITINALLPRCTVMTKASNRETVKSANRYRWTAHSSSISGLITVVSRTIEYTLLRDVLFGLQCERGRSRPSVWPPQEANASWGDVWMTVPSTPWGERGRVESRCPAYDVATKKHVPR